MAERTYVVEIRNKTSDGAGRKVGGAGGIQNAQGGESTQKSGKSANKKNAGDLLAKTAKGLITYSAVSNIVDTIYSYNNSLIEVRTGSRELQERTTYNYNLKKSLVNSAITGGIAGSSYGPAGVAVGALIGFVTAGISHMTNVAIQERKIAEHKRIDDIQRQTTTQRVTVSGSRYMNATQM